jgi:adenine specific DNA methylase Mod
VSRRIYERVVVCGASELGNALRLVHTMPHMLETGVFWYGDNLEVMREHLAGDGEIDLIYLDPPFNSQQSYNMFFKEADETVSQAQRTAFEDYWSWKGGQAQQAYDEIAVPRRKYLVPVKLAETMQMLKNVLGESNMMAYLAMMAVRLVEMRRLLKPSGSLYLHCDPTASHYIKLVLDALFGPENFRSEVVWKRTGAHGSANRWGDVHDVILFYSKTDLYIWNKATQAFGDNYVNKKYRFTDSRGALSPSRSYGKWDQARRIGKAMARIRSNESRATLGRSKRCNRRTACGRCRDT